jgi:outer membrane immunogenic protein
MTKGLIAITAIAALIGTPALAADLDFKAAPLPTAHYSWTGCYAGGNFGGGIGLNEWSPSPADVAQVAATLAPPPMNTAGSIIGESALGAVPVTNLGSDVPVGYAYGIQGGCDYQFRSYLVVGVQADFSWSNLRGSHTTTGPTSFGDMNFVDFTESFTSHTNVDRFSTITARLGYPSDRALFYVKGGVASINDDYSFTDSVVANVAPTSGVVISGAAAPTIWGWTAGAGFEYALLPNLSAFVEYDYLGFASHDVNFTCSGFTYNPVTTNNNWCGLNFATGVANSTVPIEVRQQINVVKLGLNYRFNWWGGH